MSQPMPLRSRTPVIFSIILFVLTLDQVSKIIVRAEIPLYETINLIDNFLTLTRVENSGAFLSLGSNYPYFLKLVLLNFIPVLVLLYGIYFLITRRNLPYRLLTAICLVIGGGAGNLYDRIRYGTVTDFLHINLGFVQTGVFNAADVFITAGIGLIFLDYLVSRRGR